MSLFLDHIPFYSFPVQSHDATREELHSNDPFSIDIDDTPPVIDQLPPTDPPPTDPLPITDPLPADHQDPPFTEALS